ncbi:MAG: cupredoxin domain-containing protein, partial [Candidatus Nitrosotenuis sp.]
MFLGANAKDSTESVVPVSNPNSVLITISSSRPGCEAAHACYVPHEITIKQGESVNWTNDDSAFHTVTSGYYDEPDGLLDSQQLDPAQKFSHVFSEPGQFQYYCRLHPWMEGKIIVS